MSKYDFNISYSALATYKGCQRAFYYTYIEKAKATDFVTDAYSLAGSIVHSMLEQYYVKYKNKQISIQEIQKHFYDAWTNANIDNKQGFYGHSLDKIKYWNAIVTGLNRKYSVLKTEERIVFNDYYTVKGTLDVVCNDCIVDWKTNSNSDAGQLQQLKFYAYLYYRKYKKLPAKFILDYVKINKTLHASFTYDDVKSIHAELSKFVTEIESKRVFTDWLINKNSCTFCPFKTKCARADAELSSDETFVLELSNAKITFKNELSLMFRKLLDKKTSYEIDNKQIVIQMLKRKNITWDGVVHKFKRNSLSICFYSLVIQVIQEYSSMYNIHSSIKIIDNRTTPTVFDVSKKRSYELRQYQSNAVDAAIHSKIGILALATGAGKTLIAVEIFRQLSVKTLFVVDTLLLAKQAKAEFEKFLNVNAALMTSGQYADSIITIATIQTLNSKLKAKDSQFIKYVNSVACVFFDEAHIAKSASYSRLRTHLINCHYFVGLTGTPGKDKTNFLDLQENSGDVIATVKTVDLIQAKYLVKPVIYFVKYSFGQVLTGTYSETLEQLLSNSERNTIIYKLALKHKNNKVLIITSRVQQAKILHEQLQNANISSGLILGEVDLKSRATALVNANVLIGTSSIVSKGLNLPELNVIINTTGNVSDIQTIQSLGRLLRTSKNKTQAIYYDMYDDLPFFREHALARIEQFKSELHDVQIVDASDLITSK